MKNYIFKKKNLKMTSVYMVFDAGSRLETEGMHGTMHLMEHLICKTFRDMYEELTKFGIRWNAFTSAECVCVYFMGLDKYLTNELKEKLYRRITGGISCVTKEDFENERSVVHQEYLDCVFDSEYASMMNVMRKWWGDYTAIGNESDILDFTHDDMVRVYAERFTKPARIVEVGRKRTEFFETIEFNDVCKSDWKYKYKKRNLPLVNVASDEKVSVYVFSKKCVSKRDYPYLQVGVDMLTSGLESPFYRELREKLGLTYYVRGYVANNYDNGALVFNACTDSANLDVLKNKLSEIVKNVKLYLTKERYETIMSKLTIDRETVDAVLYEDPWRFADISKMKLPNKLDSLTYEKVVDVTMKYLQDFVVMTIND